MKKDDRTYDHAMQAYAPEVVIKCCNVTGQVFTADSFDYAKHDQFWMRDCFFSRGAIQNLTKYFGKVLTVYFDTPPYRPRQPYARKRSDIYLSYRDFKFVQHVQFY